MSKLPALYTIDAELEALELELFDAGGEVDDDTEARHNELLEQRDDKWAAYVAIIKRLGGQADLYASERKRLQQAERSAKAAAERMKARLFDSMARAGVDVQETPLGKLRVQEASRRSVEVLVEVEDLDERFIKQRDPEADLAALRAAIDAGEFLNGIARLAPATKYVRIY